MSLRWSLRVDSIVVPILMLGIDSTVVVSLLILGVDSTVIVPLLIQ